MSRQVAREETDEYAVRRFEPHDRDGVCSLCEVQWGEEPPADWFEWKYVENPYLSHVPVTVAERDGELVGTQAYLPCRIRRGGRSLLALQPTDAVVHPEHRRKGLYTRITREAIDYYVEREPAFFYNFPNEAALGAQERLGWSKVAEIPNYYRVQRPTAAFDSATEGATRRALGRAGDAVAGAYLAGRDFASNAAGEVEVVRHSSVPAETLADLYESDAPRTLHVHREAEFYRWFFDAPTFDHATYVARRADRPVASLVTRTRDGDRVRVVDALPLASRSEAFADLLGAAIADHEDAAVIVVAGSTLPRDLLARFGFVSDQRPVASRVCETQYMATRPLWRDAGPVPRDTLADDVEWHATFVEQTD